MTSSPELESGAGSTWPDVVVVMPVRNEATTLAESVDAVLDQGYPGRMTICLAIAPSNDGTESVARDLAIRDERVELVDNPAQVTPAGLNAAIAASRAEVVVRADGHSELNPGYIERAVETLTRTGAANVGGVQHAVGTTPFERAVATAMTSRFGTGGAAFHVGGSEGPTDTVYLGVFRRDALDAVGRFDERLVRNQDYELNIRLRGAGYVVWFDPQLAVTYRPRGSIRALARQYFDYGRWKRAVVRLHPGSMRARQAIPPVVTLGLALTALLGARWRSLWLAPTAYASAITVVSAREARSTGEFPLLLVVFPTMHLAWGIGFLVGRAGLGE